MGCGRRLPRLAVGHGCDCPGLTRPKRRAGIGITVYACGEDEAALFREMAPRLGVALTLTDGRWLPRKQMLSLAGRPTADFAYARWMGPDRSLVDFSRIQVDRTRELETWAGVLWELAEQGFDVYGYVNNHFAGHSPSSTRDMQKLLGQRPVEPEQLGEQMTLF